MEKKEKQEKKENFKINYDPKLLCVLHEHNIEIDYCCNIVNNEVNICCTKNQLEFLKSENSNIQYIKTEDPAPIKQLKSCICKRKNINVSLGTYHFQRDLELFLEKYARLYSSIFSYTSIGKSVENRDLFMVHIGPQIQNADSNSSLKSIAFIGNIHGNETIGRELNLYFIDYLCKSYNKDAKIKNLVNNVNIYIMPSLNPDGFEHKTNLNEWDPQRYNANNVDLNRNFPYKNNENEDIIPNTLEPETQSLMEWYKNHNIELSLTIHNGSIVVNYPLDSPIHNSNKTPDDNKLKFISYEYAKNNTMFEKSWAYNGITNGAQWYIVKGSLQDWRYNFNTNIDLTLELSYEKVVEEENFEKYWNANKPSYIRMLEIVNNDNYFTPIVIRPQKDAPVKKEENKVITLAKTMHASLMQFKKS